MIVGSEEWCAFPTLNVPAIKARVDSGAKTSSMFAQNVQTFSRDGRSWVSFDICPLQNNGTAVRGEAPVFDRRVIKSSNGASEKRYVIKVPLSISDTVWEIEITLANRDSMGYRMLLGREAMADRILVDPSAKLLMGDYTKDELEAFYHAPEKSRGGLKIGLLASNPALYSNQRIIEAAEARGHSIEFYNIQQSYMVLDHGTPCVVYRGGKILNELDAVIPRIRPSMTFYGCALVRQFESLDILTLNTAKAITCSRDKLYSLQLLQASGVAIPKTGFANSPNDTDDLIDLVGGAPLIVKLLEGTQGKGVVLAETRKAAESVIGALKSLKANLLVQEFIKEASGKDLRLFVIDGRVVATIERSAAPGEFRANIHRGGVARKITPTPEERSLAVKAAKSLGLQVAGVDIIRSSRGPLLLEVNSSPGLEGIESASGKDIAEMMIKMIEKKLKWTPPKKSE